MRTVRDWLRRHVLVVSAAVVVLGYAVALGAWTSGGIGTDSAAGVPVQAPLSAPAGAGQTAGGTSGAGPARGTAEVVTFRATGTAPLGQVGYAVGTRTKRTVYSTASPFVRTVAATSTDRLAMTVRVSPDGGRATCTISIDGAVQVTHTVRGAFEVAACVY